MRLFTQLSKHRASQFFATSNASEHVHFKGLNMCDPILATTVPGRFFM
jgi:hypothetical protein